MILSNGAVTEDLLNYRDGNIEKGLGIDIEEFDKYVSFKRGEFTVILGHDNVGKTYWFFWYALALSSHHDITWTVWSGENKPWQIVRDLIQMYKGVKFQDLTREEIRLAQYQIESWFKFVDNSKLYKPDELLTIFAESNTDAYFIDPFTGLDRDFGYEANYKFLNSVRQFCNKTKKSIFLATHPNTESGRAGRIYPKEHNFAGELMSPMKDMVEGGKSFSNRVDNFYVVHRLLKMNHMRYITMISVDKVKDKESGGDITLRDQEIYCDFNSGLGFTVQGREGIKRTTSKGMPKGIGFEDEDNDLPF